MALGAGGGGVVVVLRGPGRAGSGCLCVRPCPFNAVGGGGCVCSGARPRSAGGSSPSTPRGRGGHRLRPGHRGVQAAVILPARRQGVTPTGVPGPSRNASRLLRPRGLFTRPESSAPGRRASRRPLPRGVVHPPGNPGPSREENRGPGPRGLYPTGNLSPCRRASRHPRPGGFPPDREPRPQPEGEPEPAPQGVVHPTGMLSHSRVTPVGCPAPGGVRDRGEGFQKPGRLETDGALRVGPAPAAVGARQSVESIVGRPSRVVGV